MSLYWHSKTSLTSWHSERRNFIVTSTSKSESHRVSRQVAYDFGAAVDAFAITALAAAIRTSIADSSIDVCDGCPVKAPKRSGYFLFNSAACGSILSREVRAVERKAWSFAICSYSRCLRRFRCLWRRVPGRSVSVSDRAAGCRGTCGSSFGCCRRYTCRSG